MPASPPERWAVRLRLGAALEYSEAYHWCKAARLPHNGDCGLQLGELRLKHLRMMENNCLRRVAALPANIQAGCCAAY